VRNKIRWVLRRGKDESRAALPIIFPFRNRFPIRYARPSLNGKHVRQIRTRASSEHPSHREITLKSLNFSKNKADEIEQLDGYPALHVDQWVHRDRYVPRYNVAPRTHAPVIRRAQPEEPALVMHSMRWGLVPHWSKAEPPTLNTINARAENLEEGGGMWASVKGRKRCVVVAQGCVPRPWLYTKRMVHGNTHAHSHICRRYYEWLKKGSQRVPHFTRHKDQRLMLFAGLYDSVTFEGE
jgi:hypothetical protein